MSELRNAENLANPWPAQQDNNERIESRLWERPPSTQNGQYTTLIGPPPGTNWPVNKLWWDALRALFVCVGQDNYSLENQWVQLDPAVVAQFPSGTIPDKYRVIRTDRNFEQYFYDAAKLSWRPVAGGNATTNQKNAVRVATVAALPANTRDANVLTATSNGSINDAGLDEVTGLALNDRVLVKNEAAAENNGLYFVFQVGDADNPWSLTRTEDADTDDKVTAGMLVPVTEGTVNGGKSFVLATSDPIVLNVTGLVFDTFVPNTFVAPLTVKAEGANTGSTTIGAASIEINDADAAQIAMLDGAGLTLNGSTGQELLRTDRLNYGLIMERFPGKLTLQSGLIQMENQDAGMPVLRIHRDEGLICESFDGRLLHASFMDARLKFGKTWKVDFGITNFQAVIDTTGTAFTKVAGSNRTFTYRIYASSSDSYGRSVYSSDYCEATVSDAGLPTGQRYRIKLTWDWAFGEVAKVIRAIDSNGYTNGKLWHFGQGPMVSDNNDFVSDATYFPAEYNNYCTPQGDFNFEGYNPYLRAMSAGFTHQLRIPTMDPTIFPVFDGGSSEGFLWVGGGTGGVGLWVFYAGTWHVIHFDA